MTGPIIINYDKAIFKKCIKCRQWKAKEDHTDENGREWKKAFGPHDDNADGYQVICYQCKGVANTAARNKNVAYRIRHHTGTRCLTQLGECAPDNFVKNLEHYLGYKIRALVKYLRNDLKEREGPKRSLRDALNEGYHIDHKVPLSSFNVLKIGTDGADVVDWVEFERCWAMTNLRAIPAEENLAKGAKQDDASSTGKADTNAAEDVDTTTEASQEEIPQEGSKEVSINISADIRR